jgi:hypothetical protein
VTTVIDFITVFILKGNPMKTLIALIALAVSSISFAAEPAKKEEAKAPVKVESKTEANCVTKDKNGKCPAAPKSEKPTPKKVEAKKDEKKVVAPKVEAPKAEAAKK